MRLFTSPIFRHVARGMTGPAQRGFVTSTRQFQQDANMSNLLAAAQKLEHAANARSTEKYSPVSEDDIDQHGTSPNTDGRSLGTKKPMKGVRIRCERNYMWLASPKMDNLMLSYVYLRDLCKCSRCVDPHSKQRSFRLSDIPDDIKPLHTKWDGEYLEVTWNKDLKGTKGTHSSRWHYTYLENPSINTHDTTPKSMAPLLWDSFRMGKIQHWINYEDYMTDSDEFIAAMRNLQRTGLIFVRGIPDSREMVEKIATRMGPLRNTFYGMTWDVRTVPQAKNVAYTNQFLGFHMDLMYMNEPPGYQLLHCLENSCDGGESLFADAFAAANHMKKYRRSQYDLLTGSNLAYEYVHEDQIYYKTRPVFEVNPRTEQLRHVNYSPPFQAAIPGPKNLNQNFVYLKNALQAFTRLLDAPSQVFELKLNPGECVIFDNRRIVHARRQFNTTTGSRWLAGAYVDTDAVRSRFHICKKQNPGIWSHSSPGQSAVPLDDMNTSGSSLQSIKAAYRMGAEMARQAEVSVKEDTVEEKFVEEEPVRAEPEPIHAERSSGEGGKSQTNRWKPQNSDWKWKNSSNI